MNKTVAIVASVILLGTSTANAGDQSVTNESNGVDQVESKPRSFDRSSVQPGRWVPVKSLPETTGISETYYPPEESC